MRNIFGIVSDTEQMSPAEKESYHLSHVANENFNPDFFLKISSGHDILVIEVKAEGDDSNRNRAKCRNGLKHFETLNERFGGSGRTSAVLLLFPFPGGLPKFLRAGSQPDL